MFWFAQLILWLWLPIVLAMFLLMPPRRAVVVSLVTAWLFLPQLTFELSRIPDYSKMTATSYGIVLGAILLDPKSRFLEFRPRWIDIPVVVYCLSPIASSITNGLGLYDGLSTSLYSTILIGMPYLIGRLYFCTPEDAKDLAIGIVVGGMAYVPLCLFEVKMSPQLHTMLYGFFPFHDWSQSIRWGGYRPTVFMKHGLAVGVWMCSCAAIAFWLWRSKAVKDIFGIPMWLIVPAILVTAVLSKSTGALMLFTVVVLGMLILRYLNTKLPLYLMVVGTAVYLAARSTALLPIENVGSMLGQVLPFLGGRGESLDFRLAHENAIVGHTLPRALFGWGGWGRGFEVQVEKYGRRAIPDSMWIVAFGRQGFAGLVSLYAMYLLPIFVLLVKLKPKEWVSVRCAPLTALAMMTLIYALDGVFNAMDTPMFIVALGAVGGMAAAVKRSPVRTAQAQPESPARGVGPKPAFPSGSGLGDDLDDPMPLVLIDPPPSRGSGGADR